MPIRLQADADFNQIIVSAVVRRSPEIDFRTATAAGLAGLKDTEVLALAGRDGRISSHMTTRRCQSTSESSSGRRQARDSSSCHKALRFGRSSMLSSSFGQRHNPRTGSTGSSTCRSEAQEIGGSQCADGVSGRDRCRCSHAQCGRDGIGLSARSNDAYYRVKLIVTVTRTGTGTPFRRVGLYSHCRTASNAA
jgi:hypothetical protein